MTDSTTQPIHGSPAIEDPSRLATRLIQRAHNRDGLPEIAVGLFFLFLAGLYAAQHLLETQWPVFNRIPLAPLLMIPLIFITPWAVKRVRARYLIERTGYVEMNPLSKRRRILTASIGVVVAIVVSAAVALAIRAHFTSIGQWSLAATGVFGGVLCPICGKAWRFVFLGAIFAALGVYLGVRDVEFETGWAILYGVTGALTAISGTVVLIRYLNQAPEAGD